MECNSIYMRKELASFDPGAPEPIRSESFSPAALQKNCSSKGIVCQSASPRQRHFIATAFTASLCEIRWLPLTRASCIKDKLLSRAVEKRFLIIVEYMPSHASLLIQQALAAASLRGTNGVGHVSLRAAWEWTRVSTCLHTPTIYLRGILSLFHIINTYGNAVFLKMRLNSNCLERKHLIPWKALFAPRGIILSVN